MLGEKVKIEVSRDLETLVLVLADCAGAKKETCFEGDWGGGTGESGSADAFAFAGTRARGSDGAA